MLVAFALLIGIWIGLAARPRSGGGYQAKNAPTNPVPAGHVIGQAQEDLKAGEVVSWDPSNGRIRACR